VGRRVSIEAPVKRDLPSSRRFDIPDRSRKLAGRDSSSCTVDKHLLGWWLVSIGEPGPPGGARIFSKEHAWSSGLRRVGDPAAGRRLVIVCAPDSFKGSLTAVAAAEAMAHGIEEAIGALGIDVRRVRWRTAARERSRRWCAARAGRFARRQ